MKSPVRSRASGLFNLKFVIVKPLRDGIVHLKMS